MAVRSRQNRSRGLLSLICKNHGDVKRGKGALSVCRQAKLEIGSLFFVQWTSIFRLISVCCSSIFTHISNGYGIRP